MRFIDLNRHFIKEDAIIGFRYSILGNTAVFYAIVKDYGELEIGKTEIEKETDAVIIMETIIRSMLKDCIEID